MNKGRGGRGRGGNRNFENRGDNDLRKIVSDDKKEIIADKKSNCDNHSDLDSDDLDLDDILKDIDFSEKEEEEKSRNESADGLEKKRKREFEMEKEKNNEPMFSIKKQKMENCDDTEKKENNIQEKNKGEEENNNTKKITNVMTKQDNHHDDNYLGFLNNIAWMKKMDQYVKECYRDKKDVPVYLTDDSCIILEEFHSFDDIIKNIENVNIRMALIARYQFYLWLKKNGLLPNDKGNQITEENKKKFQRWIQL